MGYSNISTRKPPLSRHPAFAPLVASWLAALMSGCVAVLPAGMINAGVAQAPLAIPAFAASQFALAGLAAIVGAGLGWAAARTFFALQHRPDNSAEAIERVVDEAEHAEPIEAEPVEPLRVEELEEIAEPVMEPEVVELEVAELEVVELEVATLEVVEEPAPEPSQVTDVTLPEAEFYSDAPFYADINLSQLLGAPMVETAEPIETQTEVDTVVEQKSVDELQSEPQPEPTPEVEQTPEPAPEAEAEPLTDPVGPQINLPQHGKAVNLLRAKETQELAMPQLIERFAVALDDQRRLAQSAMHSYSPPAAPANLTQRLRAMIEVPQPAE